MAVNKKITVLIVDDSTLVRNILTQGLSSDLNIEVIGAAGDPYEARDLIVKLKPQVLTLDVEMPKMTGVEFLKKLMPQYPIPVVMVSSLTEQGQKVTIEALEAGAVDFVSKPKANTPDALNNMLIELRTKIKIAATANVSHWKAKRSDLFSKPGVVSKLKTQSNIEMIAIGASTGGTEAIASIIRNFPSNSPGVVIVQHMPAGFTKMFADRMNSLCHMRVKEAAHGDAIVPGLVLIAPGGFQLKVMRGNGTLYVDIKPGETVCGHKPSVEVMFESVSKTVGKKSIGVILTGMGRDGAAGLKTLRDTGAHTVGQNEETCIVYGMPKVANELGGVEKELPLDSITEHVLALLKENT